MKRFVLLENGLAVGDYISERTARFRFLQVCAACSIEGNEVKLIDLDRNGETIAFF